MIAWAAGWRWFNGTTQDDRSLFDVVCPGCAGTRPKADQTWDIECQTCDWRFISDDLTPGDEALDNVRDAVALAHEHRCETELLVIDPDGNAVPLRDLDRDGNLRKSS